MVPDVMIAMAHFTERFEAVQRPVWDCLGKGLEHGGQSEWAFPFLEVCIQQLMTNPTPRYRNSVRTKIKIKVAGERKAWKKSVEKRAYILQTGDPTPTAQTIHTRNEEKRRKKKKKRKERKRRGQVTKTATCLPIARSGSAAPKKTLDAILR